MGDRLANGVDVRESVANANKKRLLPALEICLLFFG